LTIEIGDLIAIEDWNSQSAIGNFNRQSQSATGVLNPQSPIEKSAFGNRQIHNR